ncbi:hypothetical protein PCASD_26598 [Puccinia coronata f. sp. avenae]|uniref:Uncharacterized protein n=1 Tax=Puccinia coronata f. sp. avenae TaxID=200324 RepID=A0A2N5TNY3_9BASI|nr:hypothetical protein PCASD_26598 [Puccinia coronata f. sp. avenae]
MISSLSDSILLKQEEIRAELNQEEVKTLRNINSIFKNCFGKISHFALKKAQLNFNQHSDLEYSAEDFIYLPHNNLRAILIIQRTKDHWRPLAGTVQLGKLENDATNAISCSTNKDAAADAVAADYNKGSL